MDRIAIEPTQSPRVLLAFLQTSFFPDLPSAVWNHRVWMYSDLVPLLNEAITGANRGTRDLAIALRGDEIIGACVSNLENRSLKISALDSDVAIHCLEYWRKQNGGYQKVEFGFNESALATAVHTDMDEYRYMGGNRYYWGKTAPTGHPLPGDSQFRELSAADEKLYEAIEFSNGSRGWPGFGQLVENGIRYFGLFIDGELVSQSGLCRTSVHTNEIIAVGTLREEHKRQGHALHNCSETMMVGLSECACCTWTSSRENLASSNLAEKLGMRMAYETVRFEMS